MNVTAAYQVELSTMYPEDSGVTLAKLLDGIPRSKVLLIVSGLTAQVKKFSRMNELLRNWFRSENSAFANDAFKRLRTIEAEEGQIIIVTIPASLHLYAYAYNNLKEEQTLSDAQIEIHLFKCFLFINEQLNQTEKITEKTTKHLTGTDQQLAKFLTNAARNNDIVNFSLQEIFVVQILQAGFLFEFLENQSEASELLSSFYQHYDIKEWREYIQRNGGICTLILEKTKEGHLDLLLDNKENFERDSKFLDTLALIKYDETSDADFKMVRERPLYKIDNKTYRVVSNLFAFERVFKGLYFTLSEINKSLRSKGIRDFRKLYTHKFSEQYICYELLNKIFSKDEVIVTGDEAEKNKFDGAPDFYARQDKVVFLFESKNSLLNAEVKQSGDFIKLNADIEKKFYKDGKEAKAVLQLHNAARNIFNKRFQAFDKEYNPDEIIVYPVLIVHDRQVDLPGLNQLINKWFQIEISARGEIPLDKIKPITIIDIHTLILVHEALTQGVVSLRECIDEYHEFIKFGTGYVSTKDAYKLFMNSLTPFSIYVKSILLKNGLSKYPIKMIKERSGILFPDLSSDSKGFN